MSALSQRSLNLKLREEPHKVEKFSEELNSCPYCIAPMSAKASVCQVCRRSLPEVVMLKVKAVLCFVGWLIFFGLTAERFYRLYSGAIVWLRYEHGYMKYLEWLIADPGPLMLESFICAYALHYYLKKLSDRITKRPSI